MRPEDFFEIIDGIDDDIILDIPEANVEGPIKVIVKGKGTSFWTIALSAACLLCILAVGIFVAAKLQSGQRIEPGPESTMSFDPQGANKAQTFTKDFDGVVLTVTTDKTTYEVGEPINLTATLENNSGKDINLLYGGVPIGEVVELTPRFEHLIEYPIRGGIGRDDAVRVIPFKQGEKCVQDFTFQTYTEYTIETLPDYDKAAKPGVHFGSLCVHTCSETEYPYGTEMNYVLDFSVTISDRTNDTSETSQDSNSDSSEISESKPEPQPVDIGNGMMLTGMPLDNSKLEEFSVDLKDWSLTEAEEEFFDSLEIPELKDLYLRARYLTRCSRCQANIQPTFAAAGNERKPAYIDSSKYRYCETGYTYESLYNEYLRTFTKETIEEMFKEYDVFLNYNGALFYSDGARGGWLGEVHREVELVSKSDTVIEFRRLIFHRDSDNKPAKEWIPELRNEYDIGITDFKFVLTEDGWRAANIPVEYEATLQPETNEEKSPAGQEPNAYLSTKPATFASAKEQVKFTDVKEISGADFVGYELEYIMPSEMLLTLKYVYVDGEVCVSDNSGDCGVIVISPELYEKIERGNMVFWKPLFYDTPAVIYISESDVAYYASFESDADLSKGIDAIKSLV